MLRQNLAPLEFFVLNTQKKFLAVTLVPRQTRFCMLIPQESLEEFLIERYIAFAKGKNHRRFFRIWHDPWLQIPVDVEIKRRDLLFKIGQWSESARLIGAQYSRGVYDVWVGKPQFMDDKNDKWI